MCVGKMEASVIPPLDADLICRKPPIVGGGGKGEL